MNVKKAIHLVPAIWEKQMSQQVEGLVRSGQHRNLMSTIILMWESTITAGTLMTILWVSIVTPLIQKSGGSTALFQYVHHQPRLLHHQQ